MHKKILRLALPNIISNITVPLLGLVDLSIVGHMGNKAAIGAIALGTLMFNLLYWNFGFLRMGTSGFTAQALGRNDREEIYATLIRSMVIGLGIAFFLLLFHLPIAKLFFYFMEGTPNVEALAETYFRVGIIGAPAVLLLYSIMGWFIGMQNAYYPMIISIIINCVNIICSLICVYLLHMGIAGVACGTVIANYIGVCIGVFLIKRYYAEYFKELFLKKYLHWKAMKHFFVVNANIFLRTLCLICVTTYFTSLGAKQGEVILAVNTLLMQLFILFSYVADGFAYAGESLTGLYVGSGNQKLLKQFIKTLFLWGGILAFIYTFLYWQLGEPLLHLLTNDIVIIEASSAYFTYALFIPIAGFASFLWDGIFIGATAAKEMRNSIFIATLIFFFLIWWLFPYYGNHALWLSFLSYLACRGIAQTFMVKKIFNITSN